MPTPKPEAGPADDLTPGADRIECRSSRADLRPRQECQDRRRGTHPSSPGRAWRRASAEPSRKRCGSADRRHQCGGRHSGSHPGRHGWTAHRAAGRPARLRQRGGPTRSRTRSSRSSSATPHTRRCARFLGDRHLLSTPRSWTPYSRDARPPAQCRKRSTSRWMRSSDTRLGPKTSQALATSPIPHRTMGKTGQKKPPLATAQITTMNVLKVR